MCRFVALERPEYQEQEHEQEATFVGDAGQQKGQWLELLSARFDR